MRLNRFVAQATGLSRRAADAAIDEGRVSVDGNTAITGTVLHDNATVTLDGAVITPSSHRTVVLNKPVGYITSRAQQGATDTIYAVLPPELSTLKPVGRLDKDSSGLLLLTNDGDLAHRLTHPSHNHRKVYEVGVTPELTDIHQAQIEQGGVTLPDGVSRFEVSKLPGGQGLIVTLREGRNRQIRRTFEALGYRIDRLHRTSMGGLVLGDLGRGQWRDLTTAELLELAQ